SRARQRGSASRRSAGERTGPATGCNPQNEPQPLTVYVSCDPANTSASASRKRSPRAVSSASASPEASVSWTAAPAAMVNALLLKVPPCGSPPTSGSNTAMTSRLPPKAPNDSPPPMRSEEHTSELQSRENLVCRLLLEKKNKVDY